MDPEYFQLSGANLTPDEFAYRQLKEIAKAYNNGWVPDWDNGSEYKYYPWFIWKGSGFSCLDFIYDLSVSALGSRLVFKNRDHAIDAIEKFQSVYNNFLKP